MQTQKLIVINAIVSALLAPLLGYWAATMFPRGVLAPMYVILLGAVILQSPSIYHLLRDRK